MRGNSFLTVTKLFLLLLPLALLTSCGSDSSSTDSSGEKQSRPAKLVVVGLSDTEVFLNYPAVITSQQLSVLSFEVGGVLKDVGVVEAQKVKKGELLAALDQRDMQAKVKSARAQFDSAEAEYQRAVRLIKGDAISRSTLEQRKSQRDVAKSQLDTAIKELESTLLRAPYDGNIAKVSVREEQAIQPGEAAISILGRGGYEATINLPSSIIALAGKKNEERASSYLTLDIAPDLKIPALFKEAALEADPSSQTYEVTFSFDSPAGVNLLPGMNGRIWFKDPRTAAAKADLISVPLTAILSEAGQKFVWVVDKESMVVSKRPVVVEEGVGANLNVSSGLTAGETIVAAGVSYLSDGMIVRPWAK